MRLENGRFVDLDRAHELFLEMTESHNHSGDQTVGELGVLLVDLARAAAVWQLSAREGWKGKPRAAHAREFSEKREQLWRELDLRGPMLRALLDALPVGKEPS